MLRTTVLSGFFLFLLVFTGQSQVQHTWTEKESFSLHHSSGDYVGINCCPAVQYRVIKKWEWTYSEIPDEATVTSVRIRFYAAPGGPNPPAHFTFNIHNIQEDINYGSPFHELFDEYPQVIHPGTTTPDQYGREYYDITADANNNILFYNAIKNAVEGVNNFVCLGFKIPQETGPNGWYDFRPWENYNNAGDVFAVDLFVHYELPEYTIQFFNSIESSLSYGSLILNNDITNPIPSGTPQSFELLDNVDIRTSELPFIVNWQGTGTTQKHNYWDLGEQNFQYILHNSFQFLSTTPSFQYSTFKLTAPVKIKNNLENLNIDGGSIELKDPWYYYENGENNWFQSNEFKTYDSPFEIQNNSSDSYGGVFLNQGWPNWEPPYYSVKASTQDVTLTNTGNPLGRSHKFYFRNWSYDANKISLQTPNSNQTAVVFKTSDAELSANLKGTNLSDDTKAYNTTSQRKIVKIPDLDGTLHSVYSSNNRIWYEMSTDNGATWSLLNNGQPIDDSQGKLPSIDYVQLLTYPAELDCWVTIIVYQEKYGSGFKIKAKSFLRIDDGPYIYRNFKELASYSTESYSNNANPVLAIDNAGYITFVWERKSSPAGLYCRRGTITVNTQFINNILGLYDTYNSKKLGNISYSTSASSINPSITVSKTVYPGPNGSGRHLAWQDYNEIKYATIAVTNQQEGITLGTIETPSYASGYPSNYLPSLSLANGKPVVSWTGYNDGNIWKITGEQENLIMKRALVKVRATNGWPGVCTQLGDNVNYVNNNSVTSASEKTVIVWSQGSTPQSKWVNRINGNFSRMQNLSHSGIESQVTMGSDFNNMYAMVFNKQSTPFYFIKSTTDFSYESIKEGELNKIIQVDSIITYGRNGIISKSGIEIVFNTGDVFVADSSVQFTFVPDTLMFNSAEELNTASRTENFWLEEGVDFFFSNLYYVIRQELADSLLTEQDQVNFKVELVKVQSGDVVGTFDNITYNKNNLEKYASIHYLVNTSGIQAGEYYLRLVTTVAGDAAYNLSNIQRNEFDLNKLNYVNVSFKGETMPVTYELSQNYPNPFNPTTTIRYQLPKDGMVTLKVYDILGAEVVTLVNEEKVAGKYEVNFNASSLASGVYLYKLQADEFVSVKKMILLK